MLGFKVNVWLHRAVLVILLLAVSARVIAQQASFGLSSGSAAAGGTTSVNLTLNNLGGAAPAALQFTLGYPASSIAGVTPNAGASASAAGKILDCTSGTTGQTSCLLYGIDSTVIGNGVLATIAVKLAAAPSLSVVPLTLTGVSVSNANGEVISNVDSGGSITVTQSASALSSLTCSPSTLSVKGPVLCAVALSSATSTPLTVSLASNNTIVTVPASVSIAAAASSAQFTATVNSFAHVHSVVLTATANGVSKTASLQLQPVVTPPASVTVSGSLGTGTGAVGGSVTLRSSSGQVIQTVTSDASGNFVFLGVVAGLYTVTPSKAGIVFSPSSRSINVTTTNVTGINFTNQTTLPPPGKISVDARASRDQQLANGSITVSPFTTHVANELLLAFVSTDAGGPSNTFVKGVTGGGLTWTLVVRTNLQSGTSEIWRAFAPKPLSNVAVSATLSETTVSSLSVMSFTGIRTTGAGGSGAIGAIGQGHGPSGSPGAGLTTTMNGSLVIGVGNDYDNAIPRATLPGQQLLHQDLSSTGDTYWVQMLNATVPLAGTHVTLGDSSPSSDQFNLAICEVLPEGGN